MSSGEALTLYFCGLISGVAMVNLFDLFTDQSAEEAARTYTAYRACIQRSTCQMTPQDWIDYYELKWRLEEKQIERTQE